MASDRKRIEVGNLAQSGERGPSQGLRSGDHSHQLPAGVNSGPPEAKRKRAPRGTFDRNAYQREYMRKRRTPGKK